MAFSSSPALRAAPCGRQGDGCFYSYGGTHVSRAILCSCHGYIYTRGVVKDRPPSQAGFFDHVLRSNESYAEKWKYVRSNPVRAGLVHTADE